MRGDGRDGCYRGDCISSIAVEYVVFCWWCASVVVFCRRALEWAVSVVVFCRRALEWAASAVCVPARVTLISSSAGAGGFGGGVMS